jgi:hypothetical protein
VHACEIAFSLTGHNLKSRAHQNWIEYNFIHDSANRELDLVDALGNTDVPGSDSVLLGNIIRKAPKMSGNKTVIQFGKDGKADHTGTIFLVHNTIVTPYKSPVVDLSAPGAKEMLVNNVGIRGVKGEEGVAWEKIGLPWEAFGKKRSALMEYDGKRGVEARPAGRASEAGAAGAAANSK